MLHPVVKINIAGAGPMIFELYPEKAPLTVQNFLALAETGFYSGLIFHKVTADLMIQGGGYDVNFAPRENGIFIKGEFAANGWAANDIKHVKGVLTMPHKLKDPDSASTQFCIMTAAEPLLDGKYAAFGRLIDGMDILDRIAAQPTGRFSKDVDVPLTLIIIESVEVCPPLEADEDEDEEE